MLKPIVAAIQGVETSIGCRHAWQWPPHWSKFGTAEQLRGRFTPAEYERAKTWQGVCGLQEMSPTKCPTCPMAIRDDGTPVIPNTAMPIVSMRRIKGRA